MTEANDLPPVVRYYLALLHAQMEAPNIEATRTHYDGYPYASAADVQDVLCPILNAHNLVPSIGRTSLIDQMETKTSRGGLQWTTDIEVTFRVAHAPSGHVEEYTVNGRRTNDKDKGVQHAITSAWKTFLLRLLNVADEKSEEGASQGGAQPAVGRGSSNARRSDQRAPGAPSRSTPSVPKPEASIEERTEFAKAQVRAFMRKGHMKGYHLEALLLTDAKIRAQTVDAMDVNDWEQVHKVTLQHPGRFDEAMKTLAEEYPTAPERVAILEKATKAVNPPGTDKVLIEAAKVVGWNDAIEYWIDELHRRASTP